MQPHTEKINSCMKEAIEEMTAALKDRNISKLAKEVGINRATLTSIRTGQCTSVTRRILKKLEEHLRAEKQQ